ncbi:MAG: hypothetical protein HY545_02885 [Candidatus Doudnabacteria bacterium]|nr:hypothetical protein [Candidatus Doudnabacteria bacterium]
MRNKGPRLPFGEREPSQDPSSEPDLPKKPGPKLDEIIDNPEVEDLSQIKTIEDIKAFTRRKVTEYRKKKSP